MQLRAILKSDWTTELLADRPYGFFFAATRGRHWT